MVNDSEARKNSDLALIIFHTYHHQIFTQENHKNGKNRFQIHDLFNMICKLCQKMAVYKWFYLLLFCVVLLLHSVKL